MTEGTDLFSRVVFSTGFLWKTPLEPYLHALGEEGFQKLELVFVDAPWDETQAQRILERARDVGLTFYSIHAPFVDVDLTAPDRDLWERSQEKIARTFPIARMLGVRVVVLHPGGIYSDTPEPIRMHRIREALENLLPRAQEHGIRMAVENMMPKFWGRRLEDLVQLLRDLPEEVGVCMDTSHLVMSGIPVEVFWEALGHRVIHTHLSDNWGEGLDDHVLPGEGGRVPWDAVMVRLLPTSLPLTFEIYHTYGDMPFRDFLHLARKRLEAFLQRYGQRGGER